MTFTHRLRGIFRPRRHRQVEARYEAADWSFLRSFLPSPVTDARKDISAGSRTEVLRKARHFYQNSPIARALIERLVTFTVGASGIVPAPKSSSARWNQRARKYWDRWGKRCDVTGRHNLASYQRMFLRAAFVDGDCFSVLTEDNLLQLIEGHRIGTPSPPPVPPDNPSDGVLTDDVGRPLKYQLLDDKRQLDRNLPAESVVQHVFLERASQPRGISILASAMQNLHDVSDIVALEKQAVKSGSSTTDIIKTKSGEYNFEEAVRNGATAPTVDSKVYYEQVFGATAKVLRTDDDFAQYRSERPSAAWQGFMDFLLASIAISTGIPPSVLTHGKIGGADTRRDLAVAQRVVECWQSEIASQMDRVWEFIIEDADGLGSAPADWRDVEWQFPVKLTVDAGREAIADREDVRSGLVTLEEYCSRYGIDWTEHVAQLAKEQERVAEADDTGQLTNRLYGNPSAAIDPPKEPGEDEEEEEPEEEEEEEAEEKPEDEAKPARA
jgi:capsid protein